MNGQPPRPGLSSAIMGKPSKTASAKLPLPRALPDELQVEGRGRKYDSSKLQSTSLLEKVDARCGAPDQRRRAQDLAIVLLFDTILGSF